MTLPETSEKQYAENYSYYDKKQEIPTKKRKEKRSIICHCEYFQIENSSQHDVQKELDKIDPISGLSNIQTTLKRHPNLGLQVFSAAPRCNLLSYFTR